MIFYFFFFSVSLYWKSEFCIYSLLVYTCFDHFCFQSYVGNYFRVFDLESLLPTTTGYSKIVQSTVWRPKMQLKAQKMRKWTFKLILSYKEVHLVAVFGLADGICPELCDLNCLLYFGTHHWIYWIDSVYWLQPSSVNVERQGEDKEFDSPLSYCCQLIVWMALRLVASFNQVPLLRSRSLYQDRPDNH